MMMTFKTDTQFPAPSFLTHYRTALKSFFNNNDDNGIGSMVLGFFVVSCRSISLHTTINTNPTKKREAHNVRDREREESDWANEKGKQKTQK